MMRNDYVIPICQEMVLSSTNSGSKLTETFHTAVVWSDPVFSLIVNLDEIITLSAAASISNTDLIQSNVDIFLDYYSHSSLALRNQMILEFDLISYSDMGFILLGSRSMRISAVSKNEFVKFRIKKFDKVIVNEGNVIFEHISDKMCIGVNLAGRETSFSLSDKNDKPIDLRSRIVPVYRK